MNENKALSLNYKKKMIEKNPLKAINSLNIKKNSA